jgi:hypothetical protein
MYGFLLGQMQTTTGCLVSVAFCDVAKAEGRKARGQQILRRVHALSRSPHPTQCERCMVRPIHDQFDANNTAATSGIATAGAAMPAAAAALSKSS